MLATFLLHQPTDFPSTGEAGELCSVDEAFLGLLNQGLCPLGSKTSGDDFRAPRSVVAEPSRHPVAPLTVPLRPILEAWEASLPWREDVAVFDVLTDRVCEGEGAGVCAEPLIGFRVELPCRDQKEENCRTRRVPQSTRNRTAVIACDVSVELTRMGGALGEVK